MLLTLLTNHISKKIYEKLDYIVKESNYKNNIPIKILIYKYTIYILVEMLDTRAQKQLSL